MTPNPMPKQNNEWEKEFDKKWTRKSKGSEDKGKYRDDWFVIHETISREVKSFILSEITKAKEEAHQQTLEDVLAIVGEDEEINTLPMGGDMNLVIDDSLARNKFRAELREKLLKLTKGKEGK